MPQNAAECRVTPLATLAEVKETPERGRVARGLTGEGQTLKKKHHIGSIIIMIDND